MLGLFFANLAAVLVARAGPIWRRLALRPLNEKGLVAWARLEESLATPLPAGFTVGPAADTLRGFGYRVRRPGERTLWGVKHHAAPLGFLFFHLSFFLICAGGALLYYTRFQGTVVLSEGQSFAGSYTSIEREPPWGGAPELLFTVEAIEPRQERGEPVHLGTRLLLEPPGGAAPVALETRVNSPARWGAATLLVNEAGLSPVLWLQDAAGFTLDRVAVPVQATPGGEPTVAPLAGGLARARVHPLAAGEPFPDRSELPATALRVELLAADLFRAPLADGRLAPGQAVEAEGLRLVLAELRFWAKVQVVRERGGGLLIAGFALGIVGVAWRLLLYRREVALTWDEAELRLVGRAEYFTHRFRQELAALRDALATATQAATSGEEGR